MERTITITAARQQFLALTKKVKRHMQTYILTNKGEAEAVLLSVAEYRSLVAAGQLALNPDVLIVTGDHSTPSFLRSHSWHPVPTLLSSKCCRSDSCQEFSERESVRGGLGQFEAKYLMLLALANAGRLGKYGA